MTDNPYASPVPTPELYAPPVRPQGVVPAAQWKRFVNLLIDNVILQVIGFAAGLAVGIAYAVSRSATAGPFTKDEEFQLNLMGYGVGLLVALIYYAGTELLCYRTPAKFLTGTIVVAEDGSPPTTGQILGRALCRFIPFEAFSFFGNPCVGWHDSIPKTRVVDAR